MHIEYDASIGNKTWELVDLPPSSKVIGSLWVLKTKTKADGVLDKYKSCLVAQGYPQKIGFDYNETYIPTIKTTALRIVLTLAFHFGWNLRQLYVNNAFLNDDLQVHVFIRQPTSFVDRFYPKRICKLIKVLHELKQAPQVWFHKLSSCLLNWGFINMKFDTSIFALHKHTGIIIVLVYVDDLIIIKSSPI